MAKQPEQKKTFCSALTVKLKVFVMHLFILNLVNIIKS